MAKDPDGDRAVGTHLDRVLERRATDRGADSAPGTTLRGSEGAATGRGGTIVGCAGAGGGTGCATGGAIEGLIGDACGGRACTEAAIVGIAATSSPFFGVNGFLNVFDISPNGWRLPGFRSSTFFLINSSSM